jgi:site-specific DNA-methyltransferase (adenine-specific)
MIEPTASEQNPSTPYYSDDFVTLYHGDCREVVEWLEADVLVTDPPYGTSRGYADGVEYGRRATRMSGYRDDLPPGAIAGDVGTGVRDGALALWGQRPALVFGSPRQADPPGEWADRLVWDKKRPGMNGGPWRYRHESIFVTAGFIRTSDAAVSIIEAWPDQKDHIHAKPLALMLRLVAAAPPGVIADPFAGSGSTLVAAKQLGRKAIGVEIDEHYCDIIARRLDQGVLDFGAVS